MSEKTVVVSKTWRSEIRTVLLFVILSVASIYLSREFPAFTINGTLLNFGDYSLVLSLPLFWFLPAFAGLKAIYRIYNVRYAIDARGVEARVGILSTHQRITRVRFEDIRSVETEQSLMDRFFDIGMVEIGTAATGEIEICFEGIAAPTAVQEMIQAERDRRQKLSKSRNLQMPREQLAAS